jgi:subtilase family serine protease
MSAGTRLCVAVLAAGLISVPGSQIAISQSRGTQPRPDFDIRERREAVPPRLSSEPGARGDERRGMRFNRDSGSARLLDRPGLSIRGAATPASVRALLVSNARRFGLDPRDLETLILERDYASRSNGVRHLVFKQVVDGYPVFDSMLAVHLRPDGTVVRITSNAASIDGRDASMTLSPADARVNAIAHAGEGVAGLASPVWLPLDGVLRTAWHVAVTAPDQTGVYDVLIDAQTAELLVRRNRVQHAEGFGRVLQGPAPADPRQPDPMPFGGGGTACPPPANHTLRSLNAPFRDPATVLGNSGRLEGNSVRVFRGSAGELSATGTFDGSAWTFDFPFNSAGSAETFLFFAMTYAHDFFYDLGFDEAAGNFQNDNFGRGGAAGDPLKANARASGRNNANYVHAPDGSSPTINMFLWDATGCWGADVDGDGTADIDGDYDLDIIVHEYHHGVSLRLNTAWTGNEAGAIGEGGGDFFAYSTNGDTQLAGYARPGGLRAVNGKHYGDWFCLLNLFCSVHDNGQIWANALWDVRERFRTDLVRGSEAAAINESHQLYIDGLKLSPPAPTMLDMRDAMLEADALRNAGSPVSQNYCRLWESFAGRGMGLSATDTSDNGLNRVVPAYDVPAGCDPPPAPPAVTVTATTPNAHEAGLVPGVFTFSRGTAGPAALIVQYLIGGTAMAGSDYTALQGSVVIPAGATTATVTVVPVDDTVVENPETVIATVTSGSGYIVGSPGSGTVSIVSNDVAPDMLVVDLQAPRTAAAGTTVNVTDTTRNQGLGAAPPSQTSFYLSVNAILDAADPVVGTRELAALAPDAATTGVTPLLIPTPLNAGTYYLFAKADAPGTLAETNEFNNTRVTTIAIGPDLQVSTMTAPSVAGPGTSIVVSDTTTNAGAANAAASTTQFFLSNNVFLDAGDAALQTRSVPALAAGASSGGSTIVTIPAGIASGTYYLFAQADAGTAVGEANEGNNAKSVLIRVGPDLTVSAMTVPTRAASGGTISITDTTRNVGAGAAPASTTAYFLSTNYVLDAADIRLGATRAVPPLGPNESNTGTTSVTLPSLTPGSWILIASADDGDAVVETQETNNARFAIVQVGPDLTLLTVSSPAAGLAGGAINVNTTVRNAGGGAAGASNVRFYLSTNVTLDASDVQLNAVRNVPALAMDATHAGSTSVPLPADKVGALYLLVVADGDQMVAESNEMNNVATRFIQISGN